MKRAVVAVTVAILVWEVRSSDPQITLRNLGCSPVNATNTMEFFGNVNLTLQNMRREISVNKTYFVTGQQARSTNPVYAMFQCRYYLSNADCLDCFDAAVKQIRNCSLFNGARVIFDGCFLRYVPRSSTHATTHLFLNILN